MSDEKLPQNVVWKPPPGYSSTKVLEGTVETVPGPNGEDMVLHLDGGDVRYLTGAIIERNFVGRRARVTIKILEDEDAGEQG